MRRQISAKLNRIFDEFIQSVKLVGLQIEIAPKIVGLPKYTRFRYQNKPY